MTVALLGILIQAGLILTRSHDSQHAYVMALYACLTVLPIMVGLYMLWNPTAFSGYGPVLNTVRHSRYQARDRYSELFLFNPADPVQLHVPQIR